MSIMPAVYGYSGKYDERGDARQSEQHAQYLLFAGLFGREKEAVNRRYYHNAAGHEGILRRGGQNGERGKQQIIPDGAHHAVAAHIEKRPAGQFRGPLLRESDKDKAERDGEDLYQHGVSGVARFRERSVAEKLADDAVKPVRDEDPGIIERSALFPAALHGQGERERHEQQTDHLARRYLLFKEQKPGVIGGGCHAIDLLRWLAGDPVEVFAYGTHRLLPQVPYDDATVAVMKFDDKTVGKVFVSTGCKRDYTMRTVIYGTKGTLICDNTSPSMTLFTVDEEGVTRNPEIIEVEVNNHNAVREFEAFADSVLHGRPVLTDAREGAKTVEVCLSIIESSKTGSPVRPDYPFYL